MKNENTEVIETPACPSCQGTVSELWSKACDFEMVSTGDEEFEYRQCCRCNTIFINPMPTDRLATIYPDNYYSFIDKSSSVAHRVKEFLDKRFFSKVLKRIPGKEIRALDIGGGTGWLLDIVCSVDHRVSHTQVVDLDSQAQRLAQAKGHSYFCGRIEDFNTNEKYNLVMLLNLIEHVAEPAEVLKKISELLSDDGVIIIKTPNVDSLDARIFRSSYWGGLHCPRHWVLFSDESIKPLVQRAGLRVKTLSLTQGAPFWAWSVLIWLNQRGLARIDRRRPVVQHPLHNILVALFAGFDFARGLFFKTSQMILILEKDRVG